MNIEFKLDEPCMNCAETGFEHIGSCWDLDPITTVSICKCCNGHGRSWTSEGYEVAAFIERFFGIKMISGIPDEKRRTQPNYD